MCGPLVPDVGLVAAARGQAVTLVGAAVGEGISSSHYFLPESAQTANAIACLCMDVSGQDVVETIAAGMGHVELIMRFTKLGKSARHARISQTAPILLSPHLPHQPLPH